MSNEELLNSIDDIEIALRHQVPMKIRIEHDTKYCPNCIMYFDKNDRGIHYCWNCGQAIKWDD